MSAEETMLVDRMFDTFLAIIVISIVFFLIGLIARFYLKRSIRKHDEEYEAKRISFRIHEGFFSRSELAWFRERLDCMTIKPSLKRPVLNIDWIDASKAVSKAIRSSNRVERRRERAAIDTERRRERIALDTGSEV